MDVAQHTFQAPHAVPPISSSVDKTPMLQQQSVIQSNQQLQQQLQSMHDSEDRDGHKRREILTRRPSYRYVYTPTMPMSQCNILLQTFYLCIF